MHLDDLVLVSADDHVVEPPDVFHHQLTKALVDARCNPARTRAV